MPKTKAGYVAIIGKPNAGKSTLLNSILGLKISIVTPKPQTTRKRVLGIYSEEECQMIFLDTPGMISPKYEMQQAMMRFVTEALEEADIVLVMADMSKYQNFDSYFNPKYLKALASSRKPKILALNKVDMLEDRNSVLPFMAELSGKGIFDEVIPISAYRDQNVDALVRLLKNYLPESPLLFDPDELSTQTQRFFVSEIIREKIFMLYQQEVPYSCEVSIVEFKERAAGKWYISAEIIAERDSQKGIIIGAKGAKLKELSEKARKEIETFLQQEVFLELFVKVRADWRDNKNYLKSFGY